MNKDEEEEDPELKNFAENNEFCGSFKVSGKTGLNVNESMEFLIKNIISRKEALKQEESEEDSDEGQKILLNDADSNILKNKDINDKKDKSCCM